MLKQPIILPTPNDERIRMLFSGFKAWSFRPGYSINAGTWWNATGRVEGAVAMFYAGDIITNVYTWTSSTGEAGTNLHKMAIFSMDGATRYGVTADVKALFATVNNVITCPLVTSWTVPQTGLYIIANLIDVGAGTRPSGFRMSGWPVTRTPNEFLNPSGNLESITSTGVGYTDMPTSLTWGTNNYLFPMAAG